MSQSYIKPFIKIVVYGQKQWKGGRKICTLLRILFISDNTLKKMTALEQVENVIFSVDSRGQWQLLSNVLMEPRSVSRSCKPGNHSIALGCQLFCYLSFVMYGFPNNLAECQYTEQFSGVTHLYENFTQVNCGSRPQDYCKYCLYHEL